MSFPQREPGNLLYKGPCDAPGCGSSDANAFYDNGTAYCFSCKTFSVTDGDNTDTPATANAPSVDFIKGEAISIPTRGLTAETCRFWNYQVGETTEGVCHLANYRDGVGALTHQKVRRAGKDFITIGNAKKPCMYGEWLWPSGGKTLTIVEGELDALSMSQANDNKWPVVSLPSGAPSAAKAVSNNYAYVASFTKIVLMFDMDEPGRTAAEEVAALLPIGKVFIAKLPEKDANATLLAHGPGALVQAFWRAAMWRPDGIVKASDLREQVLNPVHVPSLPYPYPGLNAKLLGMRLGELVTLTAGSGVGKSTLTKEIIYSLLMTHNQAVGALILEESNKETMEFLVGIDISKNIVVDRTLASEEQIAASFDKIAAKELYLYDHFGSNEIDVVLNKIRFLNKACGVQWIILDHISILISGLQTNDERKLIDEAMTKLRTLCSELGIGMFVIVHLTRPEGKLGHEDGAKVSLKNLRGSHAIAQLSNAVIAIQANEDANNSTVELEVLKNRKTGQKGSAGLLDFNMQTGRLSEAGVF